MSDEEPFDGGDPGDVKAARREAKQREAGKRLAIRRLMTDPDGREWVWDLLAMCGVYQTAFAENPYRMAFLTGQQNIGQKLLAEICEVAPELYLQMQQDKTRKPDDEPVLAE